MGAPPKSVNDRYLRLCLRGRWDAQSRRQADGIAASGQVDWLLLLDMTRGVGLAPLVFDAVRDRGVVPPDVESGLRLAYQETGADAALFSVELNSLLALFSAQRLPAIVLKGAALGEEIYGNSALRPMTDIDLLLREPDINRCLDMLQERGYQVAGIEVRAGHTLTYENEIVMRSTGIPPLTVELHWRLLDSPFYQRHIDEEWFWRSARWIGLANTQALILGVEATLLHLSAHYVLHHKGRGGTLDL